MSTVKPIASLSIFLAALFLTAAGALAPSRADACSCMAPPPPAESRDRAAAVFEGRVTEIQAPAAPGENRVVRLAVVRAWKGVTTEEVSVTTADNSAACGYEFAANQSYLIYAHANEDGTLGVSLCSRTARIEDAQADLDVLGSGVTTVDPSEPSGPVSDPPAHEQSREPPAAGGCASCTVATGARTPAAAALGALLAVALLLARRARRAQPL